MWAGAKGGTTPPMCAAGEEPTEHRRRKAAHLIVHDVLSALRHRFHAASALPPHGVLLICPDVRLKDRVGQRSWGRRHDIVDDRHRHSLEAVVRLGHTQMAQPAESTADETLEERLAALVEIRHDHTDSCPRRDAAQHPLALFW